MIPKFSFIFSQLCGLGIQTAQGRDIQGVLFTQVRGSAKKTGGQKSGAPAVPHGVASFILLHLVRASASSHGPPMWPAGAGWLGFLGSSPGLCECKSRNRQLCFRLSCRSCPVSLLQQSVGWSQSQAQAKGRRAQEVWTPGGEGPRELPQEPMTTVKNRAAGVLICHWPDVPSQDALLPHPCITLPPLGPCSPGSVGCRSQIVGTVCASPLRFTFRDLTLEAWNWPWWSHHRKLADTTHQNLFCGCFFTYFGSPVSQDTTMPTPFPCCPMYLSTSLLIRFIKDGLITMKDPTMGSIIF